MSTNQSQPEVLSEEWFRQVNGLLDAVNVVEQTPQNPTPRLPSGIYFQFPITLV